MLIYGSSGEDILYGSGGNDTIKSLADNDKLYGGSGNDKLYAVKYTTVMPPDDVLRREIAEQKELFRLQMQEAEMANKLTT